MAAALVPVGPKPTEKQLKQSLKNTKYTHYSTAAKHIIAAVERFNDLKPSIKEYTFTSGKKADLMQLNGTIPVTIIDRQYNIPIRVWLQRGYPKEKPLVFINPTADMAIAAVGYVSQEGRVQVPYLSEWKDSKSCDLATLMQVIRYKFTEECPVYAVNAHPSGAYTLPRPTNSAGHSHLAASSRSSRRSDPSLNTIAISCGHDQEMAQMRLDMEGQRNEIASLQSSLQSSREQVEQYKTRISELEQQLKNKDGSSKNLSVRNSFTSGVLDAMQKEMFQEVEKEKREKDNYKHRLDTMVTEITQVREEVGILRVEKEEYQQRLRVTAVRVRELEGIIADLQQQLKSLHSQSEVELTTTKYDNQMMVDQAGDQENESCDIIDSGDTLDECEVLKRKLKSTKNVLEVTKMKMEQMEAEKEELLSSFLAQVSQSSQVESQLIAEKEELLEELTSTKLQLSKTTGTGSSEVIGEEQKLIDELIREKRELENKLADTLRSLKHTHNQSKADNTPVEQKSSEDNSEGEGEKERFKSMLDEALRDIKSLEESKNKLQTSLVESLERIRELEEEIARAREQLGETLEQNAEMMKQLMEDSNEQELEQQEGQESTVSQESVVSQIKDKDIVSHEEITLTQNMLGTGAWGYVVEGKFRGKSVAVKCLHKEILSCFTKSQVQREISIMADLHHPNLVLFMAAVMDAPSGPMIITELLSCTLRRAYQEDLISHSNKLLIMCDVAFALNYLHCRHKSIIHRDISSTNILLEALAGNKWRAKLSDFGSANLVRQATTPGEGALVYSAPEMCTSAHKPQSSSVDVYSYGILFCEVITNTFPDHMSFTGLQQTIKSDWPNVYKVITMCLNEEPSKRPVMSDIINEVETLISMDSKEC